MTDKILLQNCDPEDVSDALFAVGHSLGIKYSESTFREAKTFGDLCDEVLALMEREHREGCTLQQAFYKVRAGILDVLGGGDHAGVEAITPSTRLDQLFPWSGRRQKIYSLQWNLRADLGLLAMKPWVGWTLFGGYLVSFLGLFIKWRYGLMAMFGCATIHWLAIRLAHRFTCSTVGDVARRFARDHYRLARRDPETVNRRELVPLIKAIFMHVLLVESEDLTADALLQ